MSIRSRFSVPNRQQDQGSENGLAPVPVSRQNVCQGHPEHSGRQEHQRAKKQGVSKGFKIIRILEEFQVIAYTPAFSSRDFEAFQHHPRQRINHEKGDDQPEECCQIVIAARHIRSFILQHFESYVL
jgi:hypothetical protein